jgi:hypothetical protein
MTGRNHVGNRSGGTNVSERNRSGRAIALLAATTPSCESATRPRIAPTPQNSATARTTNTTTASVATRRGTCAPVTSTTKAKMSRLAAPITRTFTSTWASSHSARESGVVASFSKRLPSRWREIVLPTRERGVNRTTTAR